MEEELASLKRALISLVVSSPTTMTVNSLVKDYRNIVGGAIPVAKYGYRDYITFLKERCQDIFVIEGSRFDPILTPKVTKNLKHIDQMVQKQKVQSTNKNKGKRRSVPGKMNEPVELNLIASTFNKSEPQPHNGYATKTPVHRETKHETQTAESKNTQTKEMFNIKKQSDCDTLNKELVCSAFNNNKDIDNNIEESRPSSSLSKFYKKRIPHQYSSHVEFPSTEHISDSQSSGSSSSRQFRMEELKSEIVTLVTESAAGVWYTDLGRLYKERYGRELCLSGCGGTSISWLVRGLQDRVSISRPEPTGDWLLQDPSRAGAGAGAGSGAGLGGRRAALYRPAPSPSAEPDDALPGIEFDADVFPADCMHYMDSVPGAVVGAGAGAGAQFEVLIGEVYSPSHFWMLRVGADHNLAMEDIMDEMTEYYKGEGKGRVLACGAVRVGQYCAALYDADWHRAVIVKLIDSDTVKVRHVDYGTVDTVSAAALKPLKRCWGSLPAQALRARLAGCRPCAAGRRWPRASCAGFLTRVRDRRLYANVVAVDAEEDILETFLIDTSGPKDVCITRELVRLGHADARSDSALRSDESYLYPRFEALESGETLNYAEIQNALANGISLDYVDAYRRHVPGLTGPPVVPRAQQRPTPRPSLASLTSRPGTSADPQRPTFPRPVLSGPPSFELLNRVPLRLENRAPAPAPAPAAVRLTAAECGVLEHLRATDPAAAHCYLVTAAWRSLLKPPPGF